MTDHFGSDAHTVYANLIGWDRDEIAVQCPREQDTVQHAYRAVRGDAAGDAQISAAIPANFSLRGTSAYCPPVQQIVRTLCARTEYENIAALRRSLEKSDQTATRKFFGHSNRYRLFVKCDPANAERNKELRIIDRFFGLDNVPSAKTAAFQCNLALGDFSKCKERVFAENRRTHYLHIHRTYTAATEMLLEFEGQCIGEEHTFRIALACVFMAMAADGAESLRNGPDDNDDMTRRWPVASDANAPHAASAGRLCYRQLPLILALARETIPGSIAATAEFQRAFTGAREVLHRTGIVKAMCAIFAPSPEMRAKLVGAASQSANSLLSHSRLAAMHSDTKLVRRYISSNYHDARSHAMSLRWLRAAPLPVSTVFSLLCHESAGGSTCLEGTLLCKYMDNTFASDYLQAHKNCGSSGGNQHAHYDSADALFAAEYVALRVNLHYVSYADLYYSIRVVYERFSSWTASMAFGDLRRSVADDDDYEGGGAGDGDDDSSGVGEREHDPTGCDFSDHTLQSMFAKQQAGDRELRRLRAMLSAWTLDPDEAKNHTAEEIAELKDCIAMYIEDLEQPIRESRVYRCVLQGQAKRLQRALVNNIFISGGLDARFAYLTIRRDLLPIVRAVGLGTAAFVHRKSGTTRTAPVFPLLVRAMSQIQHVAARDTVLGVDEMRDMNPEPEHKTDYARFARQISHTRVLETMLVHQNMARAALNHVMPHRYREAHLLAATNQHCQNLQLLSHLLSVYTARGIGDVFSISAGMLADPAGAWDSTLHSAVAAFTMPMRVHYIRSSTLALVKRVYDKCAAIHSALPSAQRAAVTCVTVQFPVLNRVMRWFAASQSQLLEDRGILAIFTGVGLADMLSVRSVADGNAKPASVYDDDAGSRYCKLGWRTQLRQHSEQTFINDSCVTLLEIRPDRGADLPDVVEFVNQYYQFVSHPDVIEACAAIDLVAATAAGEDDYDPEGGSETSMILVGGLFLREFYNDGLAAAAAAAAATPVPATASTGEGNAPAAEAVTKTKMLHAPFLKERYRPLLEEYAEKMTIGFDALQCSLVEEHKQVLRLLDAGRDTEPESLAEYTQFLQRYFSEDMQYMSRRKGLQASGNLCATKMDVLANFLARAEWSSLAGAEAADKDGASEAADNDESDGGGRKHAFDCVADQCTAGPKPLVSENAPGNVSMVVQVDPRYLQEWNREQDNSLSAFEERIAAKIAKTGTVTRRAQQCKSTHETVYFDCSLPIYTPTISKKSVAPAAHADSLLRGPEDYQRALDGYLHIGARYSMLFPDKGVDRQGKSAIFSALEQLYGCVEQPEVQDEDDTTANADADTAEDATVCAGAMDTDIMPAALAISHRSAAPADTGINLLDLSISSDLDREIAACKRYQVMTGGFVRAAQKALGRPEGAFGSFGRLHGGGSGGGEQNHTDV